jgi:hypothetical protein
MSKYVATFPDVNPFTRAAGMPPYILVDNTGCLFLKHQSCFFPDDGFSWLNECLKALTLPTETPHAIYADV